MMLGVCVRESVCEVLDGGDWWMAACETERGEKGEVRLRHGHSGCRPTFQTDFVELLDGMASVLTRRRSSGGSTQGRDRVSKRITHAHTSHTEMEERKKERGMEDSRLHRHAHRHLQLLLLVQLLEVVVVELRFERRQCPFRLRFRRRPRRLGCGGCCTLVV